MRAYHARVRRIKNRFPLNYRGAQRVYSIARDNNLTQARAFTHAKKLRDGIRYDRHRRLWIARRKKVAPKREEKWTTLWTLAEGFIGEEFFGVRDISPGLEIEKALKPLLKQEHARNWRLSLKAQLFEAEGMLETETIGTVSYSTDASVDLEQWWLTYYIAGRSWLIEWSKLKDPPAQLDIDHRDIDLLDPTHEIEGSPSAGFLLTRIEWQEAE